MKLKTFCTVKKGMKMKMQHTVGRRCLQIVYLIRSQYPKDTNLNLIRFNIKKPNSSIKKKKKKKGQTKA